MAERFQNEAIPGTPRIREVRIESKSDNFNPESTKRGGLRAEIDISQLFGSDQKEVTGFGGRRSFVPFKLRDNYVGVGKFDIKRMEENAAKLEKDLIMKELETLDFLEALGSTKKIVKDLKLELQQQAVIRMESSEHLRSHVKEMNNEHCHRNLLKSPDMFFMELKQANMNLGKTMNDLVLIQSCVDSLNMKTKEEKDFIGVASLAEELNNEQVKMVTETNETAFHKQNKTCLRIGEMRLVAAIKMEEAARAAEALAKAEMTVLSSGINRDGLCFPEPPTSPLTLQAQMNKDLSFNNISRIEILRTLEEAKQEVKQSNQALETALNRVEIASVKQLEAEDVFHQWNIESWKDHKAIRAKRSMKGDNFPRSSLSHVSRYV